MTEVYAAFGTTAGVAAVLTLVTETVKQSFPRVKLTGPRAVLFSWLAGPALLVGAYYLGFTPALASWRDAVAFGLVAALQSNGLYAAGSAGLAKSRTRKES